MITYYYKDGKSVKHITLNAAEYFDFVKHTPLYKTEKEARRAKV